MFLVSGRKLKNLIGKRCAFGWLGFNSLKKKSMVIFYLLGLRKRSSSVREESIRDGSLTFNSFMDWSESSVVEVVEARLGEFDGDGVRIFRSPETLPPLKFLALTLENGLGFTVAILLITRVMDPPKEFGAISLVKGTAEAMEDNPIPSGLLLLLLLLLLLVVGGVLLLVMILIR